jgi:hypothetical protein
MLIVVCLGLAFFALSSFRLTTQAATSNHDTSGLPATDPNKMPSELNHHIAGLFLIAIGLSVILSERYGSPASLRWLPPVLFIAAAVFLAVWSDDEIWPRGALSWSWLLHHDAEARQHKLYALLLAVVGCVEAMKLFPRLRRPWLKAVFPALCAIGALSLFFHSHTGDADMVMPAAASAVTHEHHHAATGMAQSPSAANHAIPSTSVSETKTPHSHEHLMTGAAEKIRIEHAWFAVIGLLVAFSKFVYDSARPPARTFRYLWPNSVMVLGFLLLMYTE